MSNQTTIASTLHIGTPPTPSNNKEWEAINIHCNGFEGLPSERGVSVYSPEFTCFGHEWRLQIYPGGHSASDEGMIAVILENLSNKSITLDFGFSVKDKLSRAVKDSVSKSADGKDFAPNGTLDITNGISYLWGAHNFCQRTEVIDALVVDGTLIVEVRMRSSLDTVTTTPFIPENPIAKSVLAMFNDEESADVLFEVGGAPAVVYAHRLILQKCASNVLGELCTSEGADETTTVLITDVKPDIFKHILCYVYGGKISDEDMKDNAKGIIDAADKYGIVGLKLEAEASLDNSTTTTFDNAIDNLLYADSKNCALLKETVMDFIAENSDEAENKLSFDDVPGSAMKDLLAAMNRAKSNASSNDLPTRRVNDLRKMLHDKGLDVDGSREMMIARLKEAL